MRLLRGGWDWLADDPHHLRGARYLQVALGLMMLFRVLTEGRFAAYLWGPSGLGWGSTEYIVGPALGPLLDLAFATEFRTVSVLVALAAGALGLVAGYRTRASTALALVALFLLEQRLPELPDGGDNITRLVLIYMLFLLPAGAKPERRSLSVWLHNVAVLAIAVQVVVLYATSGLMKAYGERWHHGTALYYVSQVEWFSLPGAREIFKNSLVVTTASYGSVLWEVLFPLAMISPLKLLWLSLGIAFHVSIAGFMGLITFSTAMIGLELFLITDPEYERIFENLGRFRERLRGLVRGKSATAPRLRLFVDGSCPDCRAAGAFIERVDLNHHIEVVSFRQDGSYSKYGIAPANVARRMHLVNLGDGSVLSGFDSLRALARHIPWLWLTRPLLGLTAALGLGDSLYDFLAARRRILPDAGACRAECHAGAHGAVHQGERS